MTQIDALHSRLAPDGCTADTSTLRKALEEARAALDAVEWMPLATHVGIMCCPWCLSSRELGHSVDCQRQAALREGTECNHECNHSAFNWDLVYRCRGCGAVLSDEACEATLEKHASRVAEECAVFLEQNANGPGGKPIITLTGDHDQRIEYRRQLLTNAANAIREKFCQDSE